MAVPVPLQAHLESIPPVGLFGQQGHSGDVQSGAVPWNFSAHQLCLLHQTALLTQTQDPGANQRKVMEAACPSLPEQKGFVICTLLSLNCLFVHVPRGVIYVFFKY